MSWPPEWAHGLVTGEVDESDVTLALEVGNWPELPRAERRAFALLVLASLGARAEGATRLRLTAVAERVARLGAGADDRDGVDLLVACLDPQKAPIPLPHALEPFVGHLGDYRPFIVDDGCLYDERTLRLERRLADGLAHRLNSPEIPIAPDILRTAMTTAADPTGRRWTTAQAQAIEAALRHPVTVISGGPGTGKTAVIGGIVRGFAALGIRTEDIAIAAPTGKAANRIAELLPPGAPVPSTLHRLLGTLADDATTGSFGFRHHENRPLHHAAVIVDEASMMGLALTGQLIGALRPGARLVLVGDADQLPAIEVGSPFRDLGPLAVRLADSHRMDPAAPAGAAVLAAARAIASGALGSCGLPAFERASDLPADGFACLDAGERPATGRRLLEAFIDHWVAIHLGAGSPAALDPDDGASIAAVLDRHRRLRLLTVTRRGFAGAVRINEMIAPRLAALVGHAVAPGGLAPSTPVLMTHNDYDRGLFNGDQGVVVRGGPGAHGGGAFVVFPRAGALVPFPLASLRGSLEVAYASTVHKAQGSELDHGALILPDADLPLLTRELVYTAVTRVRRSIVVVGRRALLEQAVARPLERSSGLAARLAMRDVL